MFKLIIADDEPIILKTMEKRFDWQSMGYELMALCNDGDAVIDYVKKNPVDVVLTDIRMCKISAAAVQDDDLVGRFHSAHPVGDHQHGFACQKAGERPLHLCLVFHIQACSSLIQQHNRRVL